MISNKLALVVKHCYIKNLIEIFTTIFFKNAFDWKDSRGQQILACYSLSTPCVDECLVYNSSNDKDRIITKTCLKTKCFIKFWQVSL